MAPLRSYALVLFACVVDSVRAGGADPSKPHAHQGLLKKYERLPPKDIGLGNLGVGDDELRQGSPVLKLLDLPGGWQRSVSIQDVKAPEKVVWSAINDLARYPKMVEGVSACDVYSQETKRMTGEEITCATYKLKAGGFTLTYYMKHIFEPKKHCMTFHLDYDRCSEVSDSVGYWYVEDLKDGWCRVYYSTDSQLPRFIPGFAKKMLVDMAAKRSTSWVSVRCNELTGYKPSGGAAVAAGCKKGLRLPTPKLTLALLLLLAADVGVLEARLGAIARLPSDLLGGRKPWQALPFFSA
jgi:ribosome-associated toxin RatA of RatAB toxin-antitoxin module